jgi:hypothetical protein
MMLGLLAFAVGYIARRILRARRRTGSWARSGLPEVLGGGLLIVFCAAAARIAPTDGTRFMALAALVLVACWMTWDDWAPEWEELWTEHDAEPVESPEPDAGELPPEYRFGDRPDWLVPAVGTTPFVIMAVGAVVGGRLAAAVTLGLAAVVVVAGVTLVYVRRHIHQREIIASVAERAGALDPAELRELVERLEAEHGRIEMRRLRRLLR